MKQKRLKPCVIYGALKSFILFDIFFAVISNRQLAYFLPSIKTENMHPVHSIIMAVIIIYISIAMLVDLIFMTIGVVFFPYVFNTYEKNLENKVLCAVFVVSAIIDFTFLAMFLIPILLYLHSPLSSNLKVSFLSTTVMGIKFMILYFIKHILVLLGLSPEIIAGLIFIRRYFDRILYDECNI